MRYFKLRSTDPLFNEQSLQLLKTMQTGYNPELPLELQEYLNAQAQFIVSVSKQYGTASTYWPELLAAGQLAFVEAWQEHIAKQKEMDQMVTSKVREAIMLAAAAQFAVPASAESPYRWALDAGEQEEMALAFAAFYADEVAEFTCQMNEQIAGIKVKAAQNEASESDLHEDIEGAKAEIAEIAPTVLSWAWAYIEKYKSALAEGHSPEWADTYARHFALTEDEVEAEQEAYAKLRAQHPARKERVNVAVYGEAHKAKLDRGEYYAAAFAKEVGMGEYETAAAYAEAFAEMRQANKSELFAHYYASAVADNIDSEYAELEAEIYEKALADGMADGWARKYADRLSTNLIERAETDEDKEYYTQEAAEYIAELQKPKS